MGTNEWQDDFNLHDQAQGGILIRPDAYVLNLKPLHDLEQARFGHVEVMFRVSVEGLHEGRIDQDRSAWTEDPMNFPRHLERVRDVLEHRLADDGFENVGAKRQLGMPIDDVDIWKL